MMLMMKELLQETRNMDISKRLGNFALCFLAAVTCCVAVSAQQLPPVSTNPNDADLRSQEKTAVREKLDVIRESAEKSERQSAKKPGTSDGRFNVDQLTFPEDTTPRTVVRKVQLTGNSLISTDKLLAAVPPVYNTSDKPLKQAQSEYLYDFRVLREVILEPGQAREISARTIQGFTQYLLSVYQRQNYAGIYVRVRPDAIKEGGKLEEDTLPIEVIEMPVSNVKTTFYDVERNKREKGYLSHSVFEKWSPAKPGQVMNNKKLDDFINLLNLDPDRYVSATISKGDAPQSLAVQYDVFEINPWHYFLQMDNSGTDDRQWNPRVGFINTNLTGRDDKLTVVAQVPAENGIEDNYSIYGSYDVPLWTPRLRLILFGARSEYDVDGGGGIDFLGSGYAYGGKLRWNVFQKKGWFFDLTTSLTREKSEVTTTLFPQFFASKVYLDLWAVGLDVHRRTDMANTSFVLERIEGIGGSSQKRFWDFATSTGARNGAERDFAIVTLAANHSQFLDTDKVQRLLGSLKYIWPDERLVPAMMTTFGGMYSVRGYEENRIVADGGVLGSIQYEYDLVRKNRAERAGSEQSQAAKGELKKVAPLVFFDYGRASTKNHVAGESGTEELSSLGLGVIVEYGEHFNAGVYYGHPLRSAGPTDKGDGHMNVGFTVRF